VPKGLNRNYLKRGLTLFVGLTLLISIPSQAFGLAKAEIAPVADPTNEPVAYIVVDAKEGTVVSSKNIHKPLNVASTSKILTALAAVNTIPADQLVEIPREAETVQPSKIGMKEGEKWKRDDLLYSLLLTSANDAAYALASASAGTIENFEKQQNRIAKELGMQDSEFGDPSGLDDSLAINGASQMSAYDLAIAGRAVLAQPVLSKMVSTMNYQFIGGDNAKHTLTNHNDTFLLGYPGANGLKTGYTQKAGRTLVTSATRGDTTLIAVVLDVAQTDEWSAQLLDGAFAAVQGGKISRSASKLPAIGVIGSKANITILKSSNSSSGFASIAGSNASGNPTGWLSLPIVSILILSLLIGLFFWRRHVVKTRKKRRRERALSAREAGRRKMMDVIDLTVEGQSELVSKT